jgi:hypothetical protein
MSQQIIPFEKRYPELTRAAEEISREVFRMINSKASRITEGPEYRAQGILEMLIEKLQKAV